MVAMNERNRWNGLAAVKNGSYQYDESNRRTRDRLVGQHVEDFLAARVAASGAQAPLLLEDTAKLEQNHADGQQPQRQHREARHGE